MVEEVINNIIEAEEKADNIIKESQVRSKEIIAKAKDDAASLLDSEKKRIQLEVLQKANVAQAGAENAARKAVEECTQKADDMAKDAIKNKEKAIEFIIGSMNEKYAK